MRTLCILYFFKFTNLIGIVVGVGDGVLALGGAIAIAADIGDPPLQCLHDGNSFHLFQHFPISFPPGFSLSTIDSSSPSCNTFATLNNFHPFSSSPQFLQMGPIICCYMHSPFISLTQPCRASSVSNSPSLLSMAITLCLQSFFPVLRISIPGILPFPP